MLSGQQFKVLGGLRRGGHVPGQEHPTHAIERSDYTDRNAPVSSCAGLPVVIGMSLHIMPSYHVHPYVCSLRVQCALYMLAADACIPLAFTGLP